VPVVVEGLVAEGLVGLVRFHQLLQLLLLPSL